MIDWKNVKYVKPGIYVTSYSAEEIAANTDEHGVFHEPSPRSETPETDAVSFDRSEGLSHPEWHEPYFAWTDYWALREVSRSLERRLQAALAERDKWIGLHAQWVIQLVRAGHPSFGSLEDAIAALIAERDSLLSLLSASQRPASPAKTAEQTETSPPA